MKMVKIPNKNYSIGDTTVTQGQWKQIMGTEPWKERSYFSFHISGLRVRQGVQEGDDYPATYVSWKDADAFCGKISEKEGKTYRLPTEAEWEYACLAGAATKYHFGDDPTELGKYAWFKQNAWDVNEKYAHQVAQKLPNKFGLYDMHGNVWEWCSDSYNKNQGYCALRGGSWSDISGDCSAWCRIYYSPELRFNYIGFRLASTIST